jgi:hypothetical protein
MCLDSIFGRSGSWEAKYSVFTFRMDSLLEAAESAW